MPKITFLPRYSRPFGRVIFLSALPETASLPMYFTLSGMTSVSSSSPQFMA
ncbi:MAG: hypothetical protein L6V93_14095 [Clostridiales bacterium]|nr:MAG: hypothetical protein L6V93_14095 [Clostridiales bacterium]